MNSWEKRVLTSRCLESGWKGFQKSKVMARAGAAPESPEIFKAALPGKKAVYWGLHRFYLQPWHSLLPPTSEPVTLVLGSGNTTRALSLQPRVAASAPSSHSSPWMALLSSLWSASSLTSAASPTHSVPSAEMLRVVCFPGWASLNRCLKVIVGLKQGS